METMELMPARVRIVSILKKALLSGEYKSGDELSLTDIAAKLGVSRTPVREAFQTLEAEGLIELRMNKGALVKNIDEKFIRDHCEMRILLESEAARRAAKNGMEETQPLLETLHRMDEDMAQVSRAEYAEVNLKLHTSIWRAADNAKLYGFLSSLWNGPSTGFANSERDHFVLSTKEHIKLLEAIQNGDSEAAKSIMTTHITRSMDNMINSFRSVHAQ